MEKITQAEKIKVFVIGIDGATFYLIKPWVKEGKLPNIAKLIEGGAHGELKSVFPPVTPPAWVSFMTGKNPGKHGIFGFYGPPRENYERPFLSSKDIQSKTIWNILSNFNKKLIAINVPMTYPPFEINGIMISGDGTPSLESDFTYPPTFRTKLLLELGEYRFDINNWQNYKSGNELSFLKEVYEITEFKKKEILYFMENYQWDFFMVHFIVCDRIQHFFWKYMDSSHPAHNPEYEKYKDVILQYYQKIDSIISLLLNRIDDNTVFIIVSDHGFGPLKKCLYLNNWLKELGLINFKEVQKLDKNNPNIYFDFIGNLSRAEINTFSTPGWAPVCESEFIINNDGRRVLFEHPPSQIKYKIQLPKKPIFLKFGIGLNPKIWAPDKGEGVLFKILISDKNKIYELFSKYIDPKNNPLDRKWHDFELSLSEFKSKEVIISFITQCGPKNDGSWCWAGWSNPHIFTSQETISKFFIPQERVDHVLKQCSSSKKYFINWMNTKAYGGYESGGGIFINLKGREPMGVVEPGDDYEDLRNFIIKKLYELKDPETREKIVDKVFKREELYSGPFIKNAPDILFIMKNFSYTPNVEGYAFLETYKNTSKLFEISAWRSGTHRLNGILIMKGKNIKKGEIIGAEIIDLAPTILYIMGIPVPSDMDGKVLKDAFEISYITKNPIAYQEIKEEGIVKIESKTEEVFSKIEEEKIKEKLRSLGYLS